MSISQDIKGQGVRGAIGKKADSVFERVTAGIPWRDFRKMLRGDPPDRPNPRLKPHSESFWLHIKPTYYHEAVTRVTHTFRLGLLSTYLFFIELVTGLILMVWYAPTPERAYSDMVRLLSNVPLGQLMRDIHRLGAEAMVIVVFLHMVRTFLTGSYKKPRQFTWLTGIVLLGATLFLSFSGYLLPWDQLSFWPSPSAPAWPRPRPHHQAQASSARPCSAHPTGWGSSSTSSCAARPTSAPAVSCVSTCSTSSSCP